MAVTSVIGEGTVVRGNVNGRGSIDIRGRVEGDVEVDGDVALGEEAAVSGNVTGAQITVAGQVMGDLCGSEAVLLERGARVVGDLVAPRIGIAEGALIRGGVRTEGEASSARRAAVVPARRTPEARPRPAPAPKPAPEKAAETPKPVDEAVEAAPKPAPEKKAEGKGPPAPVVPSLGKGARGRKKGKRG